MGYKYYDYACPNCETKCELRAKEPREVICKQCGTTMNRIYGVAGISFKGAGFYSTDYK